MDATAKRIAEAAGEAAAHRVLRDAFRLFGVDIEDQDQVNAFRADLIYARKLRKASDQAASVVVRVIVTAIALSALAMLADGLQRKLGR